MITVSDAAPAGRVVRSARARSPVARRAAAGWLLGLPFVVLFGTFVAGPVLSSLVMSFTDMRSTDLRDPLAVGLVGVDNYLALLSDQQFLKALLVTGLFVVASVPLTIVSALLVALGLNTGIGRLSTLFRVGYYLPVVTSIVAVAVVWRFLLQPETGLVNSLLAVAGIEGPNWLDDPGRPALALGSMVVMTVWRGLGTVMVIFLAGLQAVPRSLYEAAEVDGAGRWGRFRWVTLPMLRPTMLFAVVITTIGQLQFFEEPYVMTQGGPLHWTQSVSMDIYEEFGHGNYAYASAMSYALFVVIAVLTVLWFRMLRSKA